MRKLCELEESVNVNRKVVSIMKMGTNHMEAHIESEARKVADMQLQLQLLFTEQVLFTILWSLFC